LNSFTTHTGIVATLNRANVDTDAIIPKQFLKSIKRTGYGPNAFYDWRYTSAGKPNSDFELNQPRFEGRSILVTRNNFGCGSSREHAVWALIQDGYRVIIAPWKEADGKHLPAFADIFRINATKNGLLVIELSEDQVNEIFDLVEAHAGLQAVVDLVGQQIRFPVAPEKAFGFDIEDDAKEQLLEGLDDIDQTLMHEADISRFEKNHDPFIRSPLSPTPGQQGQG
jgi:3-isopropylmalate/(R)-2-methylmalate dehydratase small subunit